MTVNVQPRADLAPLLVSVEDFGQIIGLKRSSIYSLIAAGRVQPVKIGRRTLLRVSDAARLAGEDVAA